MQTPQRGRRGPSAAVSSSRPTSNFPDIPVLCPFPRGSSTAHPHALRPCRGGFQPPEWERSQKHPRPDLAAAGSGGQGHLALKSGNPANCRQRGDAGSYLWALLSVCRSDPCAQCPLSSLPHSAAWLENKRKLRRESMMTMKLIITSADTTSTGC